MVEIGYSPSVRCFEAAACGTPVISDYSPGLEIFFQPGQEILISSGPQDTLSYLQEISERQVLAIGQRGRRRVLAEHTPAHSAHQLIGYLQLAAVSNHVKSISVRE